MSTQNLRDFCDVCTADSKDNFVGLKFDGRISVKFPRGYHIDETATDEQMRAQILLLLSAINLSTKAIKSDTGFDLLDDFQMDFPFFSYLYVLNDYMTRGLYRETESYSKLDKGGKIDWKKTIKSLDPIVQNGNVIYTEFYVKRSRAKDDEIFQLIQRYCLYLSFERIGWLYTDKIFEKPPIELDKPFFLSVIHKKFRETFNDRNRQLFFHMMQIIEESDYSDNIETCRFGTTNFQYVWETMIDKVFGVLGKEKYYPSTVWMINDQEEKSSHLRPDTIMKSGSAVLVLDAKYYRYGLTGDKDHLPDSSSTHKQITYGEYIDFKRQDFKTDFGEDYQVYNAFLLPFDTVGGPFKDDSNGKPYYRFGESISTWKPGTKKQYERVQGILIDVNHLLNMNLQYSPEEIAVLTKEIVSYV